MRGGPTRNAQAMRSLLAEAALRGHEIRHYQSADPSLIVVDCSCGFATAPMFPTGAADATWTHGREVAKLAQLAEWQRQRDAARRRGRQVRAPATPPSERAVVAAWHWHHGDPA